MGKLVGGRYTKTVTSPYDVAEHLRSPEKMAAYLEASIEEASRLLVGGFLPDRSSPFDCDWSPELDAVKLREDGLATLHGGLWHTTSLQRFDCIARDQKILPDPPIPDAERGAPEWVQITFLTFGRWEG